MGGLTRRATVHGVGSIPVQTTSMSIRSELAEVMRPFTTGSVLKARHHLKRRSKGGGLRRIIGAAPLLS
jgi:succinyl-CoA synthetase beta subunit